MCSSNSENDSSEDEDRGILYDDNEDTKVCIHMSNNKNHRRSSASRKYNTANKIDMSIDE